MNEVKPREVLQGEAIEALNELAGNES